MARLASSRSPFSSAASLWAAAIFGVLVGCSDAPTEEATDPGSTPSPNDDAGTTTTPTTDPPTCGPGFHISSSGEGCTPCEAETFSDEKDLEYCKDWRVCQDGRIMLVEGSSTTDRICDDDWVSRPVAGAVGLELGAMSLAPTGETFLVGRSSASSNVIRKLDVSGSKISDTSFGQGQIINMVTVHANKAGRVVAVTANATDAASVWVRSYTADGAEAWSHQIPIPRNNLYMASTIDEQGNVAIAVMHSSAIFPGDTDDEALKKPLWIASWNKAGQSILNVRVGRFESYPTYAIAQVSSVAFDKDANLFVTGYYDEDFNASGGGGFIRKLNGTTGAEMWTFPHLLPGNILRNAYVDQIKILPAPFGDVFVAFLSINFSSGYREVNTEFHAYTPDGGLMNGERFGQHSDKTGGETVSDLTVDADNGVRLLGFTSVDASIKTMAYVRRYTKTLTSPNNPDSAKYLVHKTWIFQPEKSPYSFPTGGTIPQFLRMDPRGNSYIALEANGSSGFFALVKTRTVGNEISLNYSHVF